MPTSRNNNAFIRWQGRQIDEFGRVTNLFLTIAIATIAFIINLIINRDFKFFYCTEKAWFLLGVLFLIFAVIFLLVLTINRLFSIRITTRIARNTISDSKISELRTKTANHDRYTWRLFFTSAILFMIGECLVTIVCGIHIWQLH